jgi:CubicO group peptidase (beta-lactamase class C family)
MNAHPIREVCSSAPVSTTAVPGVVRHGLRVDTGEESMIDIPARLSRRSFVASVSLAAAGLCAGAPRAVRAATGTSQDDAPPDDLDAFIRSRLESTRVPGVSLAIIRDGRLLYTEGYGFANLAQRRPMRADTLINVGSVTKTITCTAVMQLWERKRFALDDDVNAHLPFAVRNPGYPAVPVTFRQLLTHTSSIADGPAYEESYACGDPRVPLGRWLRDNLAAGGATYDAQRNYHAWKPGARYEYSNVAYGVLGHLVENLSGSSYSDYVLQNVFAPLGMAHSRFLLAGMDPGTHATPYTYEKSGDVAAVRLRDPAWTPPADVRGGVQVPHCLYSFATPPDGLARTSASELARFLLAYVNGGELEGHRLLEATTVAQILSDQQVHPAGIEGRRSLQGLAWHGLNGLGTATNWGHGGGDPGISTLMAFSPHDRSGVVALTNSDDPGDLTVDIARRALGA